MDQVQKTSTTSASTEVKCSECNDTGWIYIQESNTYRKCQCVEIEYVKRLWENFGAKSNEIKKLNDYVPFDDLTKNAKDKAVNYITNFDETRLSRENGFGLFGQPGAGKSHIVIAIGAALLNRSNEPIPVVYMPYLETMRELKANVLDDDYYNKLINRYSRSKVLIIDDLFKDKVKKGRLVGELSETDMKHIYPILNYRYLNYLPTLISTECTPKMLLDLDEALAGRILECCGDNITVFQNQKYNYRMRKFVKEG